MDSQYIEEFDRFQFSPYSKNIKWEGGFRFSYVDEEGLILFSSIPNRATSHSCGYDLYASMTNGNQKEIIKARSIKMFNTGVKLVVPISMQNNIYAKIESRSSLAKKGLIIVGGIIDSDYLGEIKVLMKNDLDNDIELDLKCAIGQIIIHNYVQCCNTVINTLPDEFHSFNGIAYELNQKRIELENSCSYRSRGIGGFGSTNKN